MKRNGACNVLDVLLWRSEVIVGLKIRIFFIIEGGWSSDRYEGGLNLFYAPETDLGPRWTQTPEKGLFRHTLACFHHLWALFCLKPTGVVYSTPKLNFRLLAKTKILVPVFVCIFSLSLLRINRCSNFGNADPSPQQLTCDLNFIWKGILSLLL